jgi:hypothetical protein
MVYVRAKSGNVVARISASERVGFRVAVVPGHYTIAAVGDVARGCSAASVIAQADKSTHVNVYTTCDVP